MNIKNIITELEPLDYLIEKSKLTMIFNDSKILIIDDFDTQLMYSFFIKRQLISADLVNENVFIFKFKKYLKNGK